MIPLIEIVVLFLDWVNNKKNYFKTIEENQVKVEKGGNVCTKDFGQENLRGKDSDFCCAVQKCKSIVFCYEEKSIHSVEKQRKILLGNFKEEKLRFVANRVF